MYLSCATSKKNRIPEASQQLTLFVGPDLQEVGGVSTYCQSIVASYPGRIEYFPFPLGLGARPLAFLKVLVAFFKRIRCKERVLVHLNTSFNASALYRDYFFFLLALLCGRQVAVFIHGWEPEFAASLTGWRRRCFLLLFNRAGVVFVLGEVFRQELVKLGVTSTVAVETTCFPSDIEQRAAGLLAPATEIAPRILFLSRLVREKGAFELADACALLLSSYPTLQLDVAGDGPDLPLLEEYARNRGYRFVNFHGCATGAAKWSLYRKATLFCLPTYFGEGLPVTIMEAMYFGLPVVTTRVGGIPDVFTHGENGVEVEPRSVEDLADKLRLLLGDAESMIRISRSNAEYARTRFTPEIVAERLARAHRQVPCHG